MNTMLHQGKSKMHTKPDVSMRQELLSALTEMGLDTVSKDLADIKHIVSTVQTKQSDLQASLEFTQKAQEATKEDVRILRNHNEQLMKRLQFSENRITELENKVINLETNIDGTQYHSMKNNLVFYNIPEAPKENTRLILMNFLKGDMQIPRECFKIEQLDTSQPPNTVWVERCHRFGQGGPSRPRPIVAVCVLGREIIMSHTKQLAGTDFFVAQQLPPKLAEDKYKISHVYREAKTQGKKPRFVGKGSAVLVDDEIHRLPTIPKCHLSTTELLEYKNKIQVSSSNIVTEQGNHFAAHVTRVNSAADISPALSVIKHSHHRLSNATHSMFAARILTEAGLQEYSDDDGEFTGARHILKAMRDCQAVNKIVVVNRWASGTQLGRRRFQIITHCTKDVIRKAEGNAMVPGGEERTNVTSPSLTMSSPQYTSYTSKAPQDSTPTQPNKRADQRPTPPQHLMSSGSPDMNSVASGGGMLPV